MTQKRSGWIHRWSPNDETDHCSQKWQDSVAWAHWSPPRQKPLRVSKERFVGNLPSACSLRGTALLLGVTQSGELEILVPSSQWASTSWGVCVEMLRNHSDLGIGMQTLHPSAGCICVRKMSSGFTALKTSRGSSGHGWEVSTARCPRHGGKGSQDQAAWAGLHNNLPGHTLTYEQMMQFERGQRDETVETRLGTGQTLDNIMLHCKHLGYTNPSRPMDCWCCLDKPLPDKRKLHAAYLSNIWTGRRCVHHYTANIYTVSQGGLLAPLLANIHTVTQWASWQSSKTKGERFCWSLGADIILHAL